MRSWSIGDVTVTQIIEFKSPVAYDAQAPFIREATPAAVLGIPWARPHYVTPEGHLLLSVHALLVETPRMRIVVDTCVGNDKPRRMTRNVALQTSFLQRMEAAGFARASVDAVVCTHLHIDHIGWNTTLEGGRWVPTFPNARYLVSRAEHEHWLADREDDEQIAGFDDSIRPVLEAGLLDLVEPRHRLCEEVQLRPTPGHTPGHVSVAIASRGEQAMITGDVIHHPVQAARPDWGVRFDSDHSQACAMRRALLEEWACTPTLVIGTHFPPPTAGRIRRDGETYRFDPAADEVAAPGAGAN